VPPSKPAWQRGLQPDVDPEEVYASFRNLLSNYLPMSQDDLGEALGGTDRTTISKWKATPAKAKAPLFKQSLAVDAVLERVRKIEEHAHRVRAMVGALQGVESAYERHSATLDGETMQELQAANDRVRELLSTPEDQP
jgi:hypothetical protein